MTSKLPFGLKTKPTRRYIFGHSISFSCSEGKLYYTITKTNRYSKIAYQRIEVISKEQLDKLLKVNNESELQTIEVVHQ